MDNYIYFFSNKWTQYKIKCLDKKIPILKGKFDSLKIIEDWTNCLILELNDEINNYSYNFQLTTLKEVFLPKILEDFINFKKNKDNFHLIINEKYFKKIKVLNLFINKQIEKDNFSKKHLKKILLKVLRFRTYFNSKLIEIESDLLTLNSKIKLLWKEIFDRDIKFLQKQQQKLKQKNILIENQKTKLKENIKDIKDKLEKELKADYQNNKLTNFKVFLEIPKKANFKIASLEKQITNLEINQYELHVQMQTLQQKNNELHEKIQQLQQKNNESNFNQRNINNQTITIQLNKPELTNKTLVNNLTMSLQFLRPTSNFN